MNPKRRFFSLFLGLILLCACVGNVRAVSVVSSGKCGDDLTWTLTSDGHLTVSGTGDMNASPWPNAKVLTAEIQEGATSIHKDAFFGCANLRSVEIAGSVQIIRDNAFSRCASLTEIVIPEGVETLGSNVFSRCTGLVRVEFPSTLRTIGNSVFYNCSALEKILVSPENGWFSATADGALFNKDGTALLRLPGAFSGSYTVPQGVKTLGYEALRGCVGLTGLTLPDSLTTVSDYAFAQCAGLETVSLPESLSQLGEGAFLECTGLTELEIPGSVTFVSPFLLYGCEALSRVVIPEGVEYIAEHAFNGCVSLAEITLPEGLTELGYGAFWNCETLSEVSIPASVKYISDQPFDGCTGLTGIWVSPDNQRFSSCDRGVLYDKEKTKLIQAPGMLSGSYTLPATVTRVDACAFDTSAGITGLLVAEGSESFSSRSGVLFSKDGTCLIQAPGGLSGHYTVPEGTLEVAYDAFHNCDALTGITLADTVTKLDAFAFYDCGALASVTLGSGVEEISSWAFSQCEALKRVVFRGEAPRIEFDSFESVEAGCYYPEGDPTWTEEVRQDYEGTLTWLPLSELPEETLMEGDANGDKRLTYQDALMVLRCSIDLEDLSADVREACDMDGSGNLSYRDAMMILRLSIGLPADPR